MEEYARMQNGEYDYKLGAGCTVIEYNRRKLELVTRKHRLIVEKQSDEEFVVVNDFPRTLPQRYAFCAKVINVEFTDDKIEELCGLLRMYNAAHEDATLTIVDFDKNYHGKTFKLSTIFNQIGQFKVDLETKSMLILLNGDTDEWKPKLTLDAFIGDILNLNLCPQADLPDKIVLQLEAIRAPHMHGNVEPYPTFLDLRELRDLRTSTVYVQDKVWDL